MVTQVSDGESTGVRWVVTQVCNLRGMGGALPFAGGTCATSGTSVTFSSFELAWVRHIV